jgi:outer membrane protein
VARMMLAVLLLSMAAAAEPRQLTLDQAIALGLQRNPDLQKQILLELSSQQDYIISRSRILPQLTLAQTGVSRTRQGAGTEVISNVSFPIGTAFENVYSAGIQVTQLVFDGGKWWNNLASSDLLVDSNKASVDEQKLQITYLIEQRFYELVRAQRQLNVLTDAARRSRDQAEFTQRLFEGGRNTQADVYSARSNRDNDEVARLGQERAVELARADLAAGIGIDPGDSLTVLEPPQMMTDPAQPPPMQDAVEKALTQRPSLKSFALVAESNRKAASAARGDYWPTVALFGAYARTANDLSSFTSSPELNSQLTGGVSVQWNIFSGFATQAAATKADIATMLSENDLASGRRGVASDVQKAVAQLAAARQQARVAQQSESNAKEGLRLALTLQEVGLGTQLDVRDAELKLTQAQLSLVGSLVDGREAEAALRRAVGG